MIGIVFGMIVVGVIKAASWERPDRAGFWRGALWLVAACSLVSVILWVPL